ncbi:MAG: PEP-CTERM sorting domain-containing protein [Candidatus Omnitrophica bacterium]|nr:PEP-CTERM sorting domain-containing protein [Candidatus Omnitrophota bacterium]
MKKIIIVLALLVAVLGVSQAAFAIPAFLTVTADNLFVDIVVNGVSLDPLGINADNWKLADTYAIDLNYGVENIIDFNVSNAGGLVTATNPAALLAQLTIEDVWFKEGGSTIVSGPESYWSIISSAFGYTPVTPDAYGDNSSSNIWYDVNGGPIAGISGAAQWIWSDADPKSAILSLKVTPVPEPMTMLLFGPALLGLVGLKRKKV